MKYWVLVFLGFLVPLTLQAQPSPTATPSPESPLSSLKFSVGGLVDTFYSFNFGNAVLGVPGDGTPGYFNGIDSKFSLALAELSLTASQGEGSGHIALIYGNTLPNDDEWAYNGVINILQAYLSYHPGNWTFSFGRFSTPMGLEVLEDNQNWNYTHSLLFTYTLPRSQTGMSVEFSPNPKISVTGYAFNGWETLDDFIYGVPNFWGLKIDFHPTPELGLTLKGILGKGDLESPTETKYVFEAIPTWKATDRLSFALDLEYAGEDYGYYSTFQYWGAALYGRYQLAPDWALALRLEEMDDPRNFLGLDGFTPLVYVVPSGSTSGSTDIEGREATLTVEHPFTKNILGRLEGRLDYALAGGIPISDLFAVGKRPEELTLTASMMFSF